MKKIHVAVVALLLGVAAAAAMLAATRTAGLATPARQDATVVARTRQLDAFEASLRRQLAQAAAQGGPAQAPRIVYHRPPAVVVTTHHGSEDGEHEGHDGRDEHDD